MPANDKASNVTAPTQFLTVKDQKYPYRRFGNGKATPLLFLQYFTGTLDNWDPAVTDPLAQRGEVILFESAGLSRSSGKVPDTVAGMAQHALAFVDALGLERCDVVGFSLGGMVAQQMVLDRPSIFGRLILVGTAPRGGEDIMHLEKPRLAKFLQDPIFKGFSVLQPVGRRSLYQPPHATQGGLGTGFGRPGRPGADDGVPRVGEIFGQAFCRSGFHTPADACRKRNSRRNDPDPEFLLAGREPAQRGAAGLSGLRARFVISVQRVLYAASRGIPRFGFAVCSLLKP